MIYKLSVIAGMQQAPTEVDRVIGIHIDMLPERSGHPLQFGFGYYAVEGWIKTPNGCSAWSCLAREHAAAVDRAGPDACSDQEHEVC
jgi:hypothetical protein